MWGGSRGADAERRERPGQPLCLSESLAQHRGPEGGAIHWQEGGSEEAEVGRDMGPQAYCSWVLGTPVPSQALDWLQDGVPLIKTTFPHLGPHRKLSGSTGNDVVLKPSSLQP